MIDDDYVLASYVREKLPYIEKSIDFQVYKANMTPSEVFRALMEYKNHLEGTADDES